MCSRVRETWKWTLNLNKELYQFHVTGNRNFNSHTYTFLFYKSYQICNHEHQNKIYKKSRRKKDKIYCKPYTRLPNLNNIVYTYLSTVQYMYTKYSLKNNKEFKKEKYCFIPAYYLYLYEYICIHLTRLDMTSYYILFNWIVCSTFVYHTFQFERFHMTNDICKLEAVSNFHCMFAQTNKCPLEHYILQILMLLHYDFSCIHYNNITTKFVWRSKSKTSLLLFQRKILTVSFLIASISSFPFSHHCLVDMKRFLFHFIYFPQNDMINVNTFYSIHSMIGTMISNIRGA